MKTIALTAIFFLTSYALMAGLVSSAYFSTRNNGGLPTYGYNKSLSGWKKYARNTNADLKRAARFFTDYLPLTGGTLNGQLTIDYANARSIYKSGSDLLAIGMWDGTNARIESANRPLYLTTYNGTVNVGSNGNTVLSVGDTRVGIGTVSPAQTLQVAGTVRSTAGTTLSHYADISYLGTSYKFGPGEVSDNVTFSISGGLTGTSGNNFLFMTQAGGVAPVEAMRISHAGNVGIGTLQPLEKLSVNGNIKAKKVIVSLIGWPDYVFEPAYPLAPLSEIEQYIKKNKRLPGIPSAVEVGEKGISVGDTQALLLKKIEELTIYIIQQQKQIDELKTQRVRSRR